MSLLDDKRSRGYFPSGWGRSLLPENVFLYTAVTAEQGKISGDLADAQSGPRQPRSSRAVSD